ncbi:TRAP transporter substrate-binding protein DctP [Pararhodobacter sp.]|uniref:TRAP transporter substrate-binding protein DctP n=1 Tax=Pararhodobacter sp. TaxID=2127056 RepID=UPI002AFF85AD|nr:TRAP transporter substrate-binding protein DctP [Pararhodobacter sp.]
MNVTTRLGRFGACALTALSLMTATTGGAGAQTVLRMATALPENHLYMNEVYTPFIERANEAAAGQFTIQPFPPPFATNTNMLDRVVSGVADIGIIQMPAIGVPFPRTDVIGLPNLTSSSEAAMAALWGLYEDGMLDAALSEQFVLLGFVTATAPRLFTRFPVHAAADLQGRRIRITGRATSDVIEALGGAPTSISITEVYQALDRGVVEGLTTAINAVAAFHFNEVVSYGVENFAFGLVPGAVIMNRQSYDRLTDEGRAALAEVTGLDLSVFIGRAMDEIDAESRQVLVGAVEMTDLSPEELAIWQAATEPAIRNWVESTDNGAAILDSYRERVAAYRRAE